MCQKISKTLLATIYSYSANLIAFIYRNHMVYVHAFWYELHILKSFHSIVQLIIMPATTSSLLSLDEFQFVICTLNDEAVQYSVLIYVSRCTLMVVTDQTISGQVVQTPMLGHCQHYLQTTTHQYHTTHIFNSKTTHHQQ